MRYGFHPPRVTRLVLPLPGLDRPVRAAHLTDLHFAYTTPLQILRDAVELTNACRPDLVVLSGDYVGYATNRLDGLQTVLGALEAPTVAVLGNHDHWTDAPAIVAALHRAGIEVLLNGWTKLAGIVVVGVDDGVTGHADPAEAVRGRPIGPALGLSHDPEVAPDLWDRHVPIVLSGHTHAGQVRFGHLTDGLHRALLGRRFVGGLYRTARGTVYVNAGVGASGLPLRLGEAAHREVAIIDLLPPDAHLAAIA
jgi:uncharacterized protein